MSLDFRAESVNGCTSGDHPEGGGSIPTSALVVGKAWQRVIRERAASQAHLLGDPSPISASEGWVRAIDYRTAATVILEYEWLGTMPTCPVASFGIYFAGVLGGAVVFAAEAAENRGVWDKYGYTGKIVTLARGACVRWAPPNAASRLIRKAISMLPTRYEIITATADSDAGEIGTVYQACGFVYVGAMRKVGSRKFYMVGGKRVSEKSARRIGLAGHAGVQRVRAQNKLRYFCFRGPHQQSHADAIAHLVKPYPKRGVIPDSRLPGFGEIGFIPGSPPLAADDCPAPKTNAVRPESRE